MSIFNALLQGIIQGLTEFLPVSSSGHLSLWQYFTGQNGETGIMFSIFLHMGTLLAVFIAFYKTILELLAEFGRMLGDIFTGKFSIKNAPPARRMIFLLIVSLVPMVFSLLLLDLFDKIAADNDIIVEGVCFLITSVLLFISDRCVKGHKNAQAMTYGDALAIGTMQALAPFPGVSRSGSTISVGLMRGLDRKYAVAFSFIMGIPPILAANVKEIAGGGLQDSAVPLYILLIGVITALVVGLIAIKLVNWLVTSEKFTVFAWYTLVLGLVTIGIGIYELAGNHALQAFVSSI